MVTHRSILGFGLAVVVALVGGCAEPKPTVAEGPSESRNADFVFTNGKVYTVNDAQPWADALVVRGGQIVYVGDSTEAAVHASEEAEMIDLAGRMLMPGFVDAHGHPVVGGLMMAGVDLQSDDVDEIFRRIHQHAASNPEHSVVQGYGVRFNPWNGDWPSAAMLDEIEAERPMFFFAIDGHAAWVNSKALDIAGITRDTLDPAPGFSYYERDESGNPTGWLVETPALMSVLTALIEIDRNYLLDGVKTWLPRFSAAGITTIQDLGLGSLPEEEGYQMLVELAEAGELPIRIQGVYYWNDKNINPIPKIQALREKFDSEMVKAVYLKINLDGGDDKHNALYVDGYTDKPDLVVEPIIPYDIINDAVLRADALGIDVVCHCFGDLAVRKMLDAIEAAIAANPPRDRRHIVTHATLVHSNDFGRFAELGVTYDTTGTWMSLDPLVQEVTTSRLGIERVNAMFPMKRIQDAGGWISFGSDWPVSGYISEYRPLMAIQVAATRQLPSRDDVPPLGGVAARLPLDLAIRTHTLGSARAIGLDSLVGSLEVGKKADITILDRNLFDVELKEISSVRVALTMMNGKVTHRDGI